MKNIRLLLLGLLTPLLCGVSFAFDLTQDELNYINNNKLAEGSFSNVSSYQLYDNWDRDHWFDVCLIFSWFTYSPNNAEYTILLSNSSYSSYAPTIYSASQPYTLICLPYYDYRYISIVRSNSNNHFNDIFSVDHYWVLNANKIINWNLGFDVQGLLDNYNQCQTDLNSCDTITNQCFEDKSILSWQLESCNSDKESLTNYNEALSTQLNECLNNQWSWVNLSWLVLNNNSLFWYLDDSLLSLPINNNLFLPLGYQGALDSWNVLYIKPIDDDEPIPYYIADEDKISIIDILSYLFIFLLWVGVIFSLIKLFRKLFTH